MEREVYIITRDEFREDGNDFTTLCIHETLKGAIAHFNQIVADERADYMYNQTGSIDTSAEAMEQAGVEEAFKTDPDGTMSWHIWLPLSWDELFIHIFRKELLD